MSTMFESVDEAKAVAASMIGIDPASFEEDPSLRVGGMEVCLLDDPDTSEEIKQEIRARIDAQKGFKATKMVRKSGLSSVLFEAVLTAGSSVKTDSVCGYSHLSTKTSRTP